ncbi:MAG: hypothetical protein RID07_12850, partial [Lacipirellulaceae bacterium]
MIDKFCQHILRQQYRQDSDVLDPERAESKIGFKRLESILIERRTVASGRIGKRGVIRHRSG